jgi:uncharacterized caspase-like protein
MRFLKFRSLIVIIVAALFTGGAWAGDKKVALVIGNSRYAHAVALANPADDARLMAATLRRTGFDVVEGIDLGYAAMRDAINRFTENAYDANVALVYYAGHGMQVNGKNYLVPIDAELTAAAHLRTRTVQIDDFLAALPPDPAVGIVILDACRDNPLSRTMASFFPQNRSNSVVGLAPIDIKPADVGTGGILIAYATDPGAVAFDGKGVNSPYTIALARHLAVPGLEIQSALTRVRSEVTAETSGRQRPWHNASLGREVFLGGEPPKPQANVAAAPAQPPAQSLTGQGPSAWDIEQRIWDEASKRNTMAHYEAYLKQFPNGSFAYLARLNMEQLNGSGAAVSSPEPPRSTGAEPSKTALSSVQPVAPPAAAPVVQQPAPPKGQTQSAAATPSTPAPAGQDVGTELTEAAIGLRFEDRVDLQQRLVALGFELGKSDGSFGAKTRAALADWQSRNGLPRTAFLTPEQVRKLIDETQPLMEEFRLRQAGSEAKSAAKPPKRSETGKSVESVKDRKRQVSSARQASKPPAPRQASRSSTSRYKTCSNVWGSFQVPADQACSAGADNIYLTPSRKKPSAPPKEVRKKAGGKWKTCSNVWGSFQVPANQACKQGNETQYLTP